MGALNRDTIISIALMVFCGFLIWAGQHIRDPQFGELPPAAWPQGVSYVLTAFVLIYFLQSIMVKTPQADGGEDIGGESRAEGMKGWLQHYRNPIACFTLYFLFLNALPYLGTLIGGTLLVFLLLSVLGGISSKKIVLHAFVAVISVGAMWSLFTFGLRVLLPRGEILPGI